MNKAIGLALLVVGLILVSYGFNASDSVSSSISRAFTGAPTDKTLWLILGGTASTVVGGVLLLRPSGRA